MDYTSVNQRIIKIYFKPQNSTSTLSNFMKYEEAVLPLSFCANKGFLTRGISFEIG